MRTSTGIPGDGHHRRVATMRAVVAVVVAVVLSVLGTGVVANAADQVAVSITDTFSPASVTIKVGTTVTWTNNDADQHELRSQSGPVEFRSNTLDRGQSASVTFNTPGTYTYLDHRHHDSAAYHGTIIVTDAAPTPPTTPGVTPPATPAPPATAAVQLAGAQFSPSTVTVAVGGTVTWSNNDGSKHTVTADDASFDSGTLNAGATFTHTFTTAGTYPYGCDFHGNMRGTVIVAAASGTPPPAPTVPAPTPTTPVAPTVPAPAPTTPAPPGGGATNESVSIAGNVFSPSTITVNMGSTVTWANNDNVTHTATADDQSFASGLLKKATSWAHTFSTPGTFTYFCEIHPEMTGTVISKAPDGSVPVAATATATSAPAAGISDQAALAAGTVASAGSNGAASGTITINDSGFTPSRFRVAVGGTLTFANQGKAMHTVTAGNGSFDSDMIKSGGSWVHTFTTAGSFTYSCILHPNMRGTIDVGGGGNRELNETAAAPGVATPTTAAADPSAAAIVPVNIDVADNEFQPNKATVAVGGTVTWKLVGQAAHTVTADDQSFNSGLLKPGESYPFTFTTRGSFTYTCLVHPGMTGTIDVVPPEQAAVLQPAPTAGGSAQVHQAAGQPEAAASTAPAKSAGVWGDTLLGIAAVLLACCVLIFALRSFLKVLGSNDGPATEAASSPPDALTPTPI